MCIFKHEVAYVRKQINFNFVYRVHTENLFQNNKRETEQILRNNKQTNTNMQFVEKEKKKKQNKTKQKQKQKKKEENKRKAYQSGIILGGFALHYRVKDQPRQRSDQSALPLSGKQNGCLVSIPLDSQIR